jgi:hypothetical protein
MIWVLSSILNLSMIFLKIEYCILSVKWIVWLCYAVGNFKYCIWYLRNWCCDMFVDFGSVITNCFGVYCIGAWLHNLGRYLSQRLYNLSPGLWYRARGSTIKLRTLQLESGALHLSQGLGYLSQGLWRLAYAYIYCDVFVCAVFHDMYMVVLLDVLVCVWVLMGRHTYISIG